MINVRLEKLEECQKKMQSQSKRESIRKLEIPNRVNHRKKDRIWTEKCHLVTEQEK